MFSVSVSFASSSHPQFNEQFYVLCVGCNLFICCFDVKSWIALRSEGKNSCTKSLHTHTLLKRRNQNSLWSFSVPIRSQFLSCITISVCLVASLLIILFNYVYISKEKTNCFFPHAHLLLCFALIYVFKTRFQRFCFLFLFLYSRSFVHFTNKLFICVRVCLFDCLLLFS